MATKTKKKTDPNVAAARAYSSEKYGPAISQVGALFGQAREQYVSDIEDAKNAAKSGKAFAVAAIPEVQKTYSQALSQADEDNAFINSELSKLGTSADVFKGAAVKAQGASHDRIKAAGADAEQSLRDRAVAAGAGEQFARNKARADYRKTIGSLQQQLLDLKTQAGDAAANKLSDLLQKDLDRETRIETAKIGAGATTRAAEIRAGAQAGKDRASGKDQYGNTRKQRIDNRSDFSAASSRAKSLKGGGKFTDPATGKTVNVPGTKTWQELYQAILDTYPNTDGLLARAAAQVAFGKLGSSTKRDLIQMGIEPPKVRVPGTIRRPGTAPAQGGNRPT